MIARNLIAGEREVGFVLGSGIVKAGGGRIVAFVGEVLVGDAHFDVVGLAGENLQRFVLRLPAEAGNGAVVAAVVGMAGDAELAFERGVGSHVGENGRIWDVLDESGAEDGSGNAEDDVTELIHLLEIRLGHHAAFGVLAPRDGEYVVNSAVRSAGEAATRRDYKGKARFAHRTFGGDEVGNRVRAAVIGGCGDLRIWAHERVILRAWAGTAYCRLRVATAAAIGVEAGPEADAGLAGHLTAHGIGLQEARKAILEKLELRRGKAREWSSGVDRASARAGILRPARGCGGAG